MRHFAFVLWACLALALCWVTATKGFPVCTCDGRPADVAPTPATMADLEPRAQPPPTMAALAEASDYDPVDKPTERLAGDRHEWRGARTGTIGPEDPPAKRARSGPRQNSDADVGAAQLWTHPNDADTALEHDASPHTDRDR